MSRTRHRAKPGGYDYWSRRPHSGFGYGPSVKRETHRAERQQGREAVEAELNSMTEPGGSGDEPAAAGKGKRVDNVQSRVIAILSDNSGYAVEDIRPESTLTGDLGMDSLDLLEATMVLEEEFNIEIDDAEAEDCKTVADVVGLVSRLMGVEA